MQGKSTGSRLNFMKLGSGLTPVRLLQPVKTRFTFFNYQLEIFSFRAQNYLLCALMARVFLLCALKARADLLCALMARADLLCAPMTCADLLWALMTCADLLCALMTCADLLCALMACADLLCALKARAFVACTKHETLSSLLSHFVQTRLSTVLSLFTQVTFLFL